MMALATMRFRPAGNSFLRRRLKNKIEIRLRFHILPEAAPKLFMSRIDL